MTTAPQIPTTQNITRRLVADAEAGAGREHAGGDVHSEEFLEEELGGVRDVNLRNARLVVAGAAFVFALLELTAVMLVDHPNIL